MHQALAAATLATHRPRWPGLTVNGLQLGNVGDLPTPTIGERTFRGVPVQIEIIDVRWSENGERLPRLGKRLRLGNSTNVPVHESYLVVGIRSAGIFLERCLEVL
jgi:hypothetical protein